MVQNITAPDTLAELPHVDTLRPEADGEVVSRYTRLDGRTTTIEPNGDLADGHPPGHVAPPPLPSAPAIEVGVEDLVYADPTEPTCIPKGQARAALASALLDCYRALYCLENVASALNRGTGGDELERLPLEGCAEVIREHVRLIGSMTIEAARDLDQGGQ